jgi:hypothetical protein
MPLEPLTVRLVLRSKHKYEQKQKRMHEHKHKREHKRNTSEWSQRQILREKKQNALTSRGCTTPSWRRTRR